MNYLFTFLVGPGDFDLDTLNDKAYYATNTGMFYRVMREDPTS